MREEEFECPVDSESGAEESTSTESSTGVLEARRAKREKDEAPGGDDAGDSFDSSTQSLSDLGDSEEDSEEDSEKDSGPTKDQIVATDCFKSGDVDRIINFFLQEGCSVDETGIYGETVIHWIGHLGMENVFRGILNLFREYPWAALVNKKDVDNQRTPLSFAMKRRAQLNTAMEKDGDAIKQCDAVIELLLEYGADPNLIDHKGFSVFDYANHDAFVFQTLRQEVIGKLHEECEMSFFDSRLQRSDDIDGDDSSDEDSSSQVGAQTFEQAWASFRRAKPSYAKTKGHQYSFMMHFYGLQVLYSKRVNALYYHHPELGKRSLGRTEFIGAENIGLWVEHGLKKTVAEYIFKKDTYDQIPEEVAVLTDRFVKRFLSQNEKIRSSEWAGIIANFLKIRKGIHSLFHEISSEDARCVRKEFDAHGGKGMESLSRESSLGHEVVVRAATQSISPPNKGELLLKLCLEKLFERVIRKKPHTDRRQERFDAIFLYNLSVSQSRYRIQFNRSLIEPTILRPMSYGYGQFGLLSCVRKVNRYDKRRMKHHEERTRAFMTYHNPGQITKRMKNFSTVLGHQLAQETRWELLSERSTLLRSITTKALVRCHLVRINDSEYPSLGDTINRYIKDAVTDISLAQAMRNILNGESDKVTFGDSNLLEFLNELVLLLFVSEPTRNPASFITHHMMLDLIIANKFTFKDFFGYSEKQKESQKKMPMAIKKAVDAARCLHRLYGPFLPYYYQYDYESGSDINSKEVGLLTRKTVNLVREWIGYKGQSYNPESVNQAINEAINGWYPAVEGVFDFLDKVTTEERRNKKPVQDSGGKAQANRSSKNESAFVRRLSFHHSGVEAAGSAEGDDDKPVVITTKHSHSSSEGSD